MASFPRDRYDDIPEELTRVGAHRAAVKAGRGWVRFGWATLTTGVLVVAGLFGLSRFDPSFQFDLPSFGMGEQTPGPGGAPIGPATPVTDPSTVDPSLDLSISVFNGTATQGLQNAAGDQIVAAGWPDPARANASDRTEEFTMVYYSSAEFEGIALGLVELLGVGRVVLSDAFPGAPITIVLGTDYVPPAA